MVDIPSSTLLGTESGYPEEYSSSWLQPIPRAGSRNALFSGALPFAGMDIWTAYEVSWLTPAGKPQVAIAEFWFPCDSVAIIESKSFKYYLNSFNQHRFAGSDAVIATLVSDLSVAVGAAVRVRFFAVDDYGLGGRFPGLCVDTLDAPSYSYVPDAGLLTFADGNVSKQRLYSHLLKSNCPVTGQPDWASIWIEYSGQRLNPESVLAYVISFRGHQDFHEHCVERVYLDLWNTGVLSELVVCARYTRRGGLDINPIRYSAGYQLSQFEGLACQRVARQ